MQKIFKKIGCHIDDSNDVSPRPFQWISQNEACLSSHSSVLILLEFWNLKAKQIFSLQSKNFGP